MANDHFMPRPGSATRKQTAWPSVLAAAVGEALLSQLGSKTQGLAS